MQGGQRSLVGRSTADQFGDERVVVVAFDHGFLGREVSEERHVGHPGGGGDFLDRGGLVPFAQEQPQGVLLDGTTGLDLLALPQAAGTRHGQNPTAA